MLFRQLFERESSTYTYLLAARKGGGALLIDPVKEEVGKYLQLIKELDLRLVFAVDTHVHADHAEDRVFTGDTLLIRSTGRTDFQNGDPRAQYQSLFGKLLKLPDEMLVYPAHDYKGWTMSTIGEEKAHNPRLQLPSEREYVDLMRSLKLSNPKLMDVAVPANIACGVD